MNYGKKSASKKRNSLISRSSMMGKRAHVSFIRVLFIGLIALCVAVSSLGIGSIRGILANTPDVNEVDIMPLGYATFLYDCNISGRDASESRPAVSLQRRMMIMKKRSTKEIKLQAKKALQGHVGTVILGLLAVYGLNTLGTILSTNLFSGTSALDLVLSEVFMLVVSLIVGIISAGLGYMLLNISRGKEFSLGDLGYFFKNQPDRVIVAGFVLALIQLVTAIPYYYVSFTTDPGLTVDSQIQWLSMTLGLLAVSTLLNFLISLPFAMTYFLMADDTELGGIQALKESARLMKGNIWRYVKLNLSFIPLLLLSVFTFYIALFWIMPYMEMSMVAFYRDLDGELDYRLPGDGTADGGFHNWTNDSGNGYDTENNDGYRN